MAITLVFIALVALLVGLLLAPKSSGRSEKTATNDKVISHPWSSGNSKETDDFAGPNAVYGPGTDED